MECLCPGIWCRSKDERLVSACATQQYARAITSNRFVMIVLVESVAQHVSDADVLRSGLLRRLFDDVGPETPVPLHTISRKGFANWVRNSPDYLDGASAFEAAQVRP
jgi:hypothetical protein